MPEPKTFPVFSDRGQIGTLLAPARFLDDRAEKTIRLDDGREVVVPADALEVRQDGSFYLRQPPPAPEIAREPDRNESTHRFPENGGPPADKIFRDGWVIEKVQVDRFIDGPIAQRREGDTLILPVVEEVWVYEKKLLLKEEIRITQRREEITG
jgi:hypothetical protein